MTERFDHVAGLDSELYVRSQTQLLQLKSQLGRTSVEDLAWEVIKRLSSASGPKAIDQPSADQIEHLCHALLCENELAGAQFIQDAQSEGASIEAVYLNYLAPAARTLGEWWNDDLVTFTDVTLGTSRMYAIMRALRHQFSSGIQVDVKSAVFVSVPGETHTLGVSMAADLFQKMGWDIDLKIGRLHDELIAEIAQTDAAIIGISFGGEHSLSALARLVIAIRIVKPHTFVVVSGSMVDETRQAIELMDVDGLASDIDDAKHLMNALWDKVEQIS